ncbi:hypothetical protein [Pyrobaculum aerophilum]|uniref:Uncharacterized protein n=1 Tax=Pyrobaculum aerophilum TaxID=13773 RepID=A0A832W4N0_9CREN|nr:MULTISPECIES: hypothetical protein [Pyrobaculum]MCX8135846.1 hypothetical protein [Pyrobaculum aerophilum]HII47139.1 hypothetical protein [Pyrobaculum aerophilum]
MCKAGRELLILSRRLASIGEMNRGYVNRARLPNIVSISPTAKFPTATM